MCRRFEVLYPPPLGTMGKERKRETILKTDQRNLYPELGLQGKFSVKSSG